MIVPTVVTSNQRRFVWDIGEHGAPVARNLRRFIEDLPAKIRPKTWAKIVRGDGTTIAHLNLRAPAPATRPDDFFPDVRPIPF